MKILKKDKRYPFRVSKHNVDITVDILLKPDNENYHYVLKQFW